MSEAVPEAAELRIGRVSTPRPQVLGRRYPCTPACTRRRLGGRRFGGEPAGTVRLHGVDTAMGEAWEAGVVLSGTSAGSLCWHVGGATDSFGPALRPVTD